MDLEREQDGAVMIGKHTGERTRRGATTLARAGRLVRAGAVGSGVAGLLLAGAPAGHAVRGEEPPPVVVTGEPLVHTFDTRVPGDSVTGVWQVSSSSSTHIAYDGVLVAGGTAPDGLASALAVSYGTTDADGRVTWHDAGTLADGVAYTAAVPRATAVVSAGEPTAIPVRVSLPDPSLLEGRAGELLSVEATFTLSYLDPRGEPSSSGGYRSGVLAATETGVLAVTGLGAWPVAAVAGALVGLGVVLRRRRRSA